MKVAVLLGGVSKEREISLRSGSAVAKALATKGHQVTALDEKPAELAEKLRALQPEAVFIAYHGLFGEDGCVQGLLEALQIPYTGSSVKASALCFDKYLTKLCARSSQIPTPAVRTFQKGTATEAWVKKYDGARPFIVKPNQEGSSLGMSRGETDLELTRGLELASRYDDFILVESLIQGREVTVSVLGGKALPIVEVVPKSGFYDFAAKYTKGQTEYFVPAPLEVTKTCEIQNLAERVFKLMGCSGVARVDFMLDAELKPYFLEVNTIPGMTETSLLPKAALTGGLNFEDLCEEILRMAAVNCPSPPFLRGEPKAGG